MLELKNITKTFGSVVVNSDASINIGKGTIHAIVGENGAGKSCLTKIFNDTISELKCRRIENA